MCAFLEVKLNALPCFLNSFGIAVSVFIYYKQQIGRCLSNDLTCEGDLPNGTKLFDFMKYC